MLLQHHLPQVRLFCPHVKVLLSGMCTFSCDFIDFNMLDLHCKAIDIMYSLDGRGISWHKSDSQSRAGCRLSNLKAAICFC